MLRLGTFQIVNFGHLCILTCALSKAILNFVLIVHSWTHFKPVFFYQKRCILRRNPGPVNINHVLSIFRFFCFAFRIRPWEYSQIFVSKIDKNVPLLHAWNEIAHLFHDNYNWHFLLFSETTRRAKEGITCRARNPLPASYGPFGTPAWKTTK